MNYSVEFCGGTHLSNLAQAKFFAIVEEGSISKGIRRIVAITGDRANESIVLANQIQGMLSHARSLHGKELEAAVTELQQLLPTAVISVPTKVAFKEELKALEKTMMAERKEAVAKQLEEAVAQATAMVAEVKEKQEKGRVACEINSADELLITELIYDGVFIDLDPKQCVALLAAITFQEKVRMGWRSDAKDDETMKVRAEMKGAYDKLKETARRVATVCNECKLPVDVEEYVGKLKPTMMEILYEWASGSKFSDICKITNVFEGTIIRYIRLLGR